MLLDVLTPGAPHQADSRARLEKALAAGPAVVCEIVYAELAWSFANDSALKAFLQDLGLDLQRSGEPALAAGGAAFRAWHEQRPPATCPHCRTPLPGRGRILADFLVGAHALHHADALLTRDRGFYRSCFKGLRLYREPK